MPARKVVLLTGNPGKMEEYARSLGRYAIRPVFAPAPRLASETEAAARRLLDAGADLVIRESADVYPPGADTPLLTHEHMAPADNISRATAWHRGPDGTVRRTEYREEVRGYLDTEHPGPGAGFGWDRVFRSAATGRSYAEDAASGNLKTSGRDLVLARVISDALHFDRAVDLAFTPTGQERLVDFGRMPLDHLRAVSWLDTPAFRASPVSRLLAAAIEGGVFYRSSLSRRERNYWLPGLNGGVPLVPKKDGIHELTFQFHDLMHAVMPDLLPTSDDAGQRRVYVLHRMIGEAISLVAADHAFVDTLARSGSDYDFAKRRIHPLFASLAADVHTEEGFRAMARANMRFALLGDDSLLRDLGAAPDALAAYRDKYERFFVEDYVWTDRNHAAMTGAGTITQSWLDGHVEALAAAGIQTLAEFADLVADRLDVDPDGLAGVPVDELAEATFAQAWESFLAPALRHAPGLDAVDPARARSNAFTRWLLGQSVMYDRYRHVPAVAGMGELIRERLAKRRPFAEPEIARLRGFHDRAVDALSSAGAISAEEARVFREVVPVFDPHFVFYDAKEDTRPSIAETVERLLPETGPSAGMAP